MGCGCPFTHKEILKDMGVREGEATAEAWKVYYMDEKKLGEYTSDTCVRDQTIKHGSLSGAKKLCGFVKAKYGKYESSSDSCVSRKVKIIKKHHPTMKHKQVVAYAINYCKRHGK